MGISIISREVMKWIAPWGLCLSLTAQPSHISPLWTSPTMHLLVGDLWNALLSGTPSKDYYRISITLLRHGEEILSLQSWAFQMHTPEWMLNEGIVRTWGPVEMSISPEWENVITKWGMQLPPGQYTVIYTIIKTDKECIWTGPVVVQKTFPLSIVHQLHPLITFPLMDDTVCGTPPLFSWTTNHPYEGVAYKVSIAPIATPQDAMMWNGTNPLWQSEKITALHWHPIWINPPMTTGWYAWTVTAYLNNEVVGQSNPARFFYKETCTEEETDSASSLPQGKYNLFVPGLKEYFIPHEDTIHLRWRSTCSQKPEIYQISDKKGTKKVEVEAQFIKPWWFISMSLPEGRHKLRIEQCEQKQEVELILYKIK
ncbi:MAG: hypothetical protein GXO48_08005 [Chlorobi bacterium]|nr:hypothetical protein [Chlorobiota bacterium]